MRRLPTIIESIDDPNLIGGAMRDIADWRPWRALLAAAFGLPMVLGALSPLYEPP